MQTGVQTPPGGTILTVRRHLNPELSDLTAIAWQITFCRQALHQYISTDPFRFCKSDGTLSVVPHIHPFLANSNIAPGDNHSVARRFLQFPETTKFLLALRITRYRQALHPNPKKPSESLYVAWRPGMCRQAVPSLGTQKCQNMMSRLAAMHSSPHAHSHWQHSPTRAQLKGSSCSSAIPSSTQGMPFRAQLEECHVLNPYPELNSRDTFRAQPKEHQQADL
ncbi:hypothetical protein DEO72_LG7g1726 [Vigna unguiculata]|uniref:Uncharacterized protein n=1 Tax=Vigna unguiculata TaxID=3917 RepID=A0A4D6MGC1_VIGUN|nr:hypothetical protein DEO72_LG7g1726 [Vigna unguiculata]